MGFVVENSRKYLTILQHRRIEESGTAVVVGDVSEV